MRPSRIANTEDSKPHVTFEGALGDNVTPLRTQRRVK
jgi:hypothetical protein